MNATPPYGYRAEAGEIVEDTEEQEVLKRIFRMREEEGTSFAKMAGRLNAEGVFNRGKFWSSGTLHYLYHREKKKFAS